ncbi:hypothetical protein K439DRAFT_1291279, partial [Ramaria rubella]
LSHPIHVYNVDGLPNESGSITEVVDLILQYKDHSGRAMFSVTLEYISLHYTWLHEHNPEVDWKSQEVQMTCCPPQC